MTSKARELRRRMSIDPDAPLPSEVPHRARPRPAVDAASPVDEDDAAAEREDDPAADDADAPAASEVSSGRAVTPEVTAAPRTATTPEPASTPGPAPPSTPGTAEPTSTPEAAEPSASQSVDPPATTKGRTAATTGGTTKRRPRAGARRGRAAEGEEWTSALDDPSIEEGRHGYRSFYLDDAVFARFRAAVYWTARRHDASGVPDNMSVGVEAYMDEVATDLERRYNDGDVFRPTPDQVRSHRKRTDVGR